MISSLIVWLLVLVVLLLVFKFRKSALTLMIFIMIVIFSVSSGYVPTMLTTRLQSEYISMPAPSWSANNAIILLCGTTVHIPDTERFVPNVFTYSRIMKAAELYFDCRKNTSACHIVVSTGDARHIGVTEASVYAKELLNLGVPQDAIILEEKSLNTFQNAKYVGEIIKKHDFNRSLLVTSGLHIKRSLLYFNFFDMNPYPVPADYYTATQPYGSSIGYAFAVTDFCVHEYKGILRFKFYNYMGWNKK